MYETMKKESVSRQPRPRRVRTPAGQKITRTSPESGHGEPDLQIAEMERTFSDRWEW